MSLQEEKVPWLQGLMSDPTPSLPDPLLDSVTQN